MTNIGPTERLCRLRTIGAMQLVEAAPAITKGALVEARDLVLLLLDEKEKEAREARRGFKAISEDRIALCRILVMLNHRLASSGN